MAEAASVSDGDVRGVTVSVNVGAGARLAS